MFLVVLVLILCSMYIMLRGQVTIYHNYGVTSDGSGEDGDAAVARSVATVTGDELRQQLGAFVVTLKGQTSSSFWYANHKEYSAVTSCRQLCYE
jgi:hypothetical protein